jgi:hypothetical protein
MADDLDDLDGPEGDPQPPQGRELVIVDLGHTPLLPVGRIWLGLI